MKQAVFDQLLRELQLRRRARSGRASRSDEIAAFIQGVPGVIAVNVTRLDARADEQGRRSRQRGSGRSPPTTQWLSQQVTLARPAVELADRASAPYLPVATPDALPLPAEILVLDPDPKNLVLGVLA